MNSINLLTLNLIILFYIIQRLIELLISKKNETILKINYQATLLSKTDSWRMKIFHTLWFISLIIEANINKTMMHFPLSLLIFYILLMAQMIRFYTIQKLGVFWTVNLLKFNQKNPQVIYSQGLFQILRHPNYFAVILEFIFLPLLLNSFITLLVFSILNLFILKYRIELEEESLDINHNYYIHFKNIKKIIPYIY